MHGESLLPVVRGEREEIRDASYVGCKGVCWSVREGEWFFIKWFNGREDELYHVTSDPGETCNLASREQAVADRLELKLRRWLSDLEQAEGER
jgi:hypothetical protein